MEPGKRYRAEPTWDEEEHLNGVAFIMDSQGDWLYDPSKEAVVPAMLPPPGMIPIHEAHRMLMEAVAQATKPFVEVMAKIPSMPVYVAMPPDQPQIERLLDELRHGVKKCRDTYPDLLSTDSLMRLCDGIEGIIKKWEGGLEHGSR